MNKDIQMLLEVEGYYGDHSRPMAVKIVAARYGITESGVRGMCSRARHSTAGQLALMDYLSKHTAKVSSSQRRVNKVVADGKGTITRHRDKVHDKPGWSVFWGDSHIPRQDMDSFALGYKLIKDLSNVHWITALNDGLDFAKISHWPDRRSIHKRAIDADIGQGLEVHSKHMSMLKWAAPRALPVALVGNHDLRIATFGKDQGLDTWNTASMMEELAGQGVVFPAGMHRENVFAVNKSLVYYHGRFAAANRVGSLVKNYKYIKRELNWRHDFEMVTGHTHSLLSHRHDNAMLYNAGCMCQVQPEYSRWAMDWQRGLVLSRIHQDKNETQLIPFIEHGDMLTARNPFNGKFYEVKLHAFSGIG